MVDAMADTIYLETARIVKTPNVLGGEPRLEDKRISVSMLVELHLRQDTSIEEICDHFPVTPAEVHASLAYYYDHTQEIDSILDQLYEAEKLAEPQRKAQIKEHTEKLERIHAQLLNREMTAVEIAGEFGITARAVRKAALNGSIPARRSGATWLIKREDAIAKWGDR